jgi:hypothetical protein
MSPESVRLAWILGLAGGAVAIVGGVAYASSKSPAAASSSGSKGKGGTSTTVPPITAAPGIAYVTLAPGLNTQVILSLSKGGVLMVYPPANMGPNPTGTTTFTVVSDTPATITAANTDTSGTVGTFQALADGSATMTFGWYDTNGNPQSATVLVSVVT